MKVPAMVALVLMATAVWAPDSAAADERQKVALVLQPLRQEGASVATWDTVLRRVLTNGLDGQLDYYAEYLDYARFPDPAYPEVLADYFRRKYAGRRIDIVLALSPQVMAFVTEVGDELFPGVPVVFYATETPERKPLTTAIVAPLDLRSTIDVALQLQPDLQQVFVVSGASESDAFYRDLARGQLRPLDGRLTFTYWSGLSMSELEARVGALPERSIVYFLTVQEDGVGNRFNGPDSLQRVVQRANRPTYSWVDLTMGRGAIGGSLLSIEALANALGAVAVRVLKGESPERIAFRQVDANVLTFDWRELQRFGIDESRIPAGSIVQFRSPGVWDQYKFYVVGAVSLVAVQSALIAGLVVQRVRRRRIELALRESEQRFRVMADQAPVLIWRSGIDKGCDFFNKPWLDFRGRTLEQEQGSGWSEGVHPDDLHPCLRIYGSRFDAREPFTMEYRLQRADGEYRWVIDAGVPRYDEAGNFAGYIGSAVDITERRDVEQQNQDLAGRLISAQEQERTRIARELHDDVSQQLAGLSIVLSGLKRKVGKPESLPEVDQTVKTLQDRTSTLAETIRNLSHELHPSVLQHTGLHEALKQHCAALKQLHRIEVAYSASGLLDSFSLEVTLCLFRVTQEALNNAVRHAQARRISVVLNATAESAELDISDDGRGFVVSERSRRGLGLRSMDERVRLVGGEVRVESRSGQGTTVAVRIPASRVPRDVV